MSDGGRRGWVGWLRQFSRASVLVFCGALLVAVQAVLRLLDAPLWLHLLGVVLVLGVAVWSELDKVNTRRTEKAEADQLKQAEAADAEARWLRGVTSSLWRWPAPPVGDTDPRTLTDLSSQPSSPAAANRPVAVKYVERDKDRQARERLRGQGLVLLIGAPSSGATRTAFELARAEDPRRLFVAPLPPLGLKRALDELDVLARLTPPQRLVLWLDQVDRFTPGGLTVPMLRQCRDRSPGLRVVATIASTRYTAWAGEEPELAAAFGEPLTLDRALSPRERARAENYYPELDLSEGIAAAFTATGALLRRMRGGDDACPFEPSGGDCPLARAVLSIAMDWVNTGTLRGMPTALLPALVARLEIPGPPDPGHLDHVLDWGAGRVVQGASLFTRVTASDGEPSTVRAHAGVAEILRVEARPGDSVWQAALDDAATAGESEAIGRMGYRAHVHGEIRWAADASARISSFDEPGARWLERAASFSEGVHRPAAQIPPLDRLLQLAETDKGPDHPLVADILNSLGNAWAELGQPGKAKELYERALTTQEREYGPDHPRVADTVNNLGNAWAELGQPGKAKNLYERALTIREREFGPDHPRVADTVNNLGTAWAGLGEPGKAKDLYERALTIQEREYGPDHPRVADTVNNLGTAWRQLGQPGKAKNLYERALTIKEREYGPDHPRVADTVNNLGTAWAELGQPGKAKNLYERALTIREREFGPDHPRVADTVDSLGTAWAELGEPGKAKDLYERALTIQEREYGPDHPRVADTLDNLGTAWAELGEPGKAKDLFERALTIQEREYGPDHPRVADTVNNLGTAWSRLGQPGKAKNLYERALTIKEREYGPDHPTVARTRRNLRRVAPDANVLNSGTIIDVFPASHQEGPRRDPTTPGPPGLEI